MGISIDLDAVILDYAETLAGGRMKREDVCFAFDGPEKSLVRLVKRAPRRGLDDYYPRWWVENLKTGEKWEEPVDESELGDPLNAMEVIAWMSS